MAGETAKGLAPYFDVELVYCFEKPGVLRDENDDASVIPFIDRALYGRLKEDGVVGGGMLPKLENALDAIDLGVGKVIITKASEIGNMTSGTHIVAKI